MKTFSIRFYTPQGRKQVAFSLAYSQRQQLVDFLSTLQIGRTETIIKDAILSAYDLAGDRREAEALAYAELAKENDKTEFIYRAILAYLPELAQELVSESVEIKKFWKETKNLA